MTTKNDLKQVVNSSKATNMGRGEKALPNSVDAEDRRQTKQKYVKCNDPNCRFCMEKDTAKAKEIILMFNHLTSDFGKHPNSRALELLKTLSMDELAEAERIVAKLIKAKRGF
ncbi:MAG: hypothetical protein FWD89_04560 [Firmicutes bacterium]|nr:hypothetical protein [Bacillota bacterium]MCL2771554.1 hypothetical protein [Bacillota bacterium]